MPSAFEVATRAALLELLQMHARSSKFGYVLTDEGAQGLIDALYDLLATSRNLKAAGDRFLAGAGPTPAPRARPTPGKPR